jgi:hypothetical protein
VCTDIFDKIFIETNYSGFACIDFCIDNDIVKIFEINSRIGESLIHNTRLMRDFISTIVENNL